MTTPTGPTPGPTPAAARPGPPFSIVLIAILAIIFSVFTLFAGGALLAVSDEVSGLTNDEAVIWGVCLLIFGVVGLMVGIGLLRLRGWALVVGLIVAGLHVLFGIAWLIGIGIDGIGWSGFFDVLFWLLVFFALYGNRDVFDA